jgi:hypothetical protein
MSALAVLGIGIILLGLIFAKPATPARPDNILHPDECVDISGELAASEVPCSGPHDAVVTVLVPFGGTCPGGTERYRDRQGMGDACVVRVAQ